MQESNRSSISQAQSLEEMGEFWDTHDFTEFDNDAPDVEFTVASSIQHPAAYRKRCAHFASKRK